MKKETKFTCGNFLVTFVLLESLAIAENLVGLVSAGITQVLQRKPASAWEKAAAGYTKRPDKFERNSIKFSDELATLMQTTMASAIVQAPEAAKAATDTTEAVEAKPAIKVSDIATLTVVEYVPEVKAYKFRDEIEIIARHESADDIEAWLEEKCGFDGAYEDSTTESGYTLDALNAVKAYVDKVTKGL